MSDNFQPYPAFSKTLEPRRQTDRQTNTKKGYYAVLIEFWFPHPTHSFRRLMRVSTCALSLYITRSLLSSTTKPRLVMASGFPAQNGGTNPYGVQDGPTAGYKTAGAGSSSSNGGGQSSHRTLTALGRWSILSKQLPPVDSISTIHVYDFDNTRTYYPPRCSFLILSSFRA